MSELEIYTMVMLVFFLQFVASSTILGARGTPSSKTDYTFPDVNWQYRSPESVGLDGKKLQELSDFIDNKKLPLYSCVITKNGYVVFEKYNHVDGDYVQAIYSTTKGIVAILMGIAIDKGYIKSVDEPISPTYFDLSQYENYTREKENITIRHLLTMSAGFTWDETSTGYDNVTNDFNKWVGSSNWISYVLNRPLDASPGTKFTFNTAVSHLLSVIIEEATGNSSFEFAKQHLFGPLGITSVSWRNGLSGYTNGGNGIVMSTYDMARIAHLVLSNGTWKEQQIVSKSWIQDMCRSHFHDTYSYQAWILPEENFGKYAINLAGFFDNKKITVLNEYGIGISLISSFNEGYKAEINNEMIADYIIPACTSADTENTKVPGFLATTLASLLTIPSMKQWIKKRRRLVNSSLSL